MDATEHPMLGVSHSTKLIQQIVHSQAPRSPPPSYESTRAAAANCAWSSLHRRRPRYRQVTDQSEQDQITNQSEKQQIGDGQVANQSEQQQQIFVDGALYHRRNKSE